MSAWQSVILAAGAGIRMRSATPKVLHQVCGVPLIQHVASALRDADFKKPIVVVAPDADEIRTYLGVNVDFAVQETPLGTGHALSCARGKIPDNAENILVINADCPLVPSEAIQHLMAVHEDNNADLTLMTTDGVGQEGFGRIVRDASGTLTAIVEEREATAEQLTMTEVNGGVYAFRAATLWPELATLKPSSKGEIYLTDMVARVHQAQGAIATVHATDSHDVLGVNTRVDLAQAEAVMRGRIQTRHMLDGVTLIDPSTTYIDTGVLIGKDTVLYPNTHLQGATQVGEACQIGPNTVLQDTVVGQRVRIVSSMLEGATLEADVDVGPFAHLRPGSHIGESTHIGNFVEIKESTLANGVKVGHFSYLGDADVGANVNIGAGTVTANFDGVEKHKTTIEENAFIGSDTMLIAPVLIGKGAATGAGSVVTKDVTAGETVVGVPARPQLRKSNKKPEKV
jgi:bifunctional UDP-N-acetylglucosamine pyrophosphorylase/glucosamine-1-phosphate N-acetyltransferase